MTLASSPLDKEASKLSKIVPRFAAISRAYNTKVFQLNNIQFCRSILSIRALFSNHHALFPLQCSIFRNWHNSALFSQLGELLLQVV